MAPLVLKLGTRFVWPAALPDHPAVMELAVPTDLQAGRVV
jgi:hypothetical protein